VAHLWKQEEQVRNVQQIAERGAELYDNSRICRRPAQTWRSYRTDTQCLRCGFDKLTRGRGNLCARWRCCVHSACSGQSACPATDAARGDVEIFEEVPEAEEPEAKNEDTLL